ncbi:MAG: hypothetical protein RL701_3159 [Pseudomonadota bacterium]
MRPPRQANVLGVLISVTDYHDATARVIAAARASKPLAVAICPAHSVIEAHRDRDFATVLNSMDMAVPDGQPVRWVMGWTHQAQLEDRVYGPTLMLHVLSAAADEGLPVFFYGSRARTLDLLCEKLLERFPRLRIAGAAEGLYRKASAAERAENAVRIRASGAKIVFCGLGCPRQEWWMFHQRQAIGVPLLGVGAAFDFHAGLVKQAPVWMQQRGLEWAFRLRQEPRRLWKRYASTNPVFAALAARQISGLTRFEPTCDVAAARARPCPI